MFEDLKSHISEENYKLLESFLLNNTSLSKEQKDKLATIIINIKKESCFCKN